MLGPRGSADHPETVGNGWSVRGGEVRMPAPEVGIGKMLFLSEGERYERRSVMISSNWVFSKWDQIIKDPLTTMAAVDRLVHHAHILELNNPSIRAAQAKKQPRD